MANTTIELGLVRVDMTFGSADTLPYLQLQHLGEISQRYSYGLKFDLRGPDDTLNETLLPFRPDSDAEYRLTGSLFVGRDLSLDVGYSGFIDPEFSDSLTEWSLGASYFVTPHWSVSLKFRRLVDEAERPSGGLVSGLDQDFDTFRFDTRVRF
ncbi:MAG: hypothetical protein AAFV47_08265 [Pseudomonadota bacterium]